VEDKDGGGCVMMKRDWGRSTTRGIVDLLRRGGGNLLLSMSSRRERGDEWHRAISMESAGGGLREERSQR
jgi:hypothetical protein